jgi:hypothetical protein
LLILRPEILGNLQLPGRILDQKLLLDCFVEDGLEIGACPLYPILALNLRQVIQVRLQLKLLHRFNRVWTELTDQVDFDLSFLLPRVSGRQSPSRMGK